MDRKIMLAAGAAAAIVVVVIAIVLLWPGKNRTTASNASVSHTQRGKAPDITINLLPPVPEAKESSAAPSQLGDFAGEIMTLSARPMLYVVGKVNVTRGTTTELQAAYGKIRAYIARHGLTMTGVPFAITLGFDQQTNVWSYKAGIALAAPPLTPPDAAAGIKLGSTYGGAAVRFVHIGDPNNAQPTYAKIAQWLNANGLKAGEPTWEEYTSDPATPMKRWRTNIYIPVE